MLLFIQIRESSSWALEIRTLGIMLVPVIASWVVWVCSQEARCACCCVVCRYLPICLGLLPGQGPCISPYERTYSDIFNYFGVPNSVLLCFPREIEQYKYWILEKGSKCQKKFLARSCACLCVCLIHGKPSCIYAEVVPIYAEVVPIYAGTSPLYAEKP